MTPINSQQSQPYGWSFSMAPSATFISWNAACPQRKKTNFGVFTARFCHLLGPFVHHLLELLTSVLCQEVTKSSNSMFRENTGSGCGVCFQLPQFRGQMPRLFFNTTFFWNCRCVSALLRYPTPLGRAQVLVAALHSGGLISWFILWLFPSFLLGNSFHLQEYINSSLEYPCLRYSVSPPAWTSNTGRGGHQIRGQGLTHLPHFTALSTTEA